MEILDLYHFICHFVNPNHVDVNKGHIHITTENRVFFSTCETLCMSLSPTKSECENVFVF